MAIEDVTSFQTIFESRTGSNLAHKLFWYLFSEVHSEESGTVKVATGLLLNRCLRLESAESLSSSPCGSLNIRKLLGLRKVTPTPHMCTLDRQTPPHMCTLSQQTPPHRRTLSQQTPPHMCTLSINTPTHQHKSGGIFQADGPVSASHRCCVRISCLRLTWPSSAST